MTVSELVTFIALVCNVDSPAKTFEYKQQCSEFYTNCMVMNGGEIPRPRTKFCLERAKVEKLKWQ